MMRRFERIYDVVEPVEEYRPGGYHPVHLHDVFHQRYEVIGKLAYGQYSTVWLAKDQQTWVLSCEVRYWDKNSRHFEAACNRSS